MHMKEVVFMSCTFKILISNWPRTRKFNRLVHARKAIAFDFSKSQALITLYVQFLCSDWSKFDRWVHVENLCSVWKLAYWLLKLTEFCVILWCFKLSFSTWYQYKMKYSCYQDCSVIHGWLVYCAFCWQMHCLSKSLEIRFRMTSFSKMRLLTCPCLRGKRVKKSQAILEHLMTFGSNISTGKPEQLLSLMCVCVFFFRFPEVERMVYIA